MLTYILVILIVGYILFELVEHVLFLWYGYLLPATDSLAAERRACWAKRSRLGPGGTEKDAFLLPASSGMLQVTIHLQPETGRLFKGSMDWF